MTKCAWMTILLATALVLAGCSAPAQESSPTTGEIEVRGTGLPVDPDVVFDRITRLTAADTPRPDSIRVRTSPPNRSSPLGDPSPAFFEIMDVDGDTDDGLNESDLAALENGVTNLGVGAIALYTGENDSRAIEYVLAHEFVHYVQAARDRPTQLTHTLGDTTDAGFVRTSLLEGAAVFTTNTYIDSYLDGPPSTERYRDLTTRLEPGSFNDYRNQQYLLGWRYLSAQRFSPTDADRVYANPPRTGEELIHRLEPGAEPLRPLTVRTDLGAYRRLSTDRLGEGFLRTTLRNGLSTSRANAAATGWGNDSLRTYYGRTGVTAPAYVWTIRFDDSEHRAQFEATLRDSLDSRGVETGGTWNLSDTDNQLEINSVGSDTSVVLAGTGSFLRETSVDGTDGNVTVTQPSK